MNRTKRLVVIAGLGTALTGGLVIPMAAWADPAPAPSSSSASATGTATPSGGERNGPRGGHGGLTAAKLAEILGLDEDKVAAALQEVRGDGSARPSGGGKEAAGQELAEALAAELGVTADKITAAMDTLREQRAAEAESALSERLKTAVTDGTLAQAEADAVLKAHRAGLLGGHRGGGRGDAGGTGTGTES
ncbi:hypothetical protein [Planomonospora venezuelensis]|uniref:Clp amino terminal domain-containing protein, pathogenicity island component n=1 Tax=Planomonospora venezuelensis TaxID=1999 RepID=A0A841D483_PLAVE|nr:hypothetical protein [Planomonospora venezuelensis]MBB5963207.1 hypothetical protein [Planomonospora venezuelensis]GIN03926.1 hypothetical protein Pve01_55840 [Planomonospora venezuelensis]